MRTRPPTRFDAIRLRLEAAECYRRAGIAETALAKARLEDLAHEFVRLAEKAERGDDAPSSEEIAAEMETAAQADAAPRSSPGPGRRSRPKASG
jgi:hypothetical protein